MTTANPTDPRAIAERYRDDFEQMARARAEYRDAWDEWNAGVLEQLGPKSMSDLAAHCYRLWEAITGEHDCFGDADGLEAWPAGGDVLDIELRGHRSCGSADWTVDEVQFATCTGGPHIEVVYMPGQGCAEVRCYWSGEGRAQVTDTVALALLEAAADMLEVA